MSRSKRIALERKWRKQAQREAKKDPLFKGKNPVLNSAARMEVGISSSARKDLFRRQAIKDGSSKREMAEMKRMGLW